MTGKTLIGSQRSFGTLSFKRLLRNFILDCGEVIPQPKKSNVLQENDKTGFEEATDDLTKSIKEKGKVVVTNVIDAEDDILEISDIDDIELIHFESDLIDDPELESHYFEKFGMINKSNAVMLRQWFPKDEEKMYLADFIDLVHYLNKLFNSRKVIGHQNSEKNAFRTDFENQMKKINEMIAHTYVSYPVFRFKWQEGPCQVS